MSSYFVPLGVVGQRAVPTAVRDLHGARAG
jgi:hypothetical protein